MEVQYHALRSEEYKPSLAIMRLFYLPNTSVGIGPSFMWLASQLVKRGRLGLRGVGNQYQPYMLGTCI